MAVFTITVNEAINLPPSQIGNNLNINMLYEDNEYLFTIDDFTTFTIPQYQDPEGDAVKMIKITTLPTIGELQFNNVAIIAGFEFEASQIANFKYLNNLANVESYEVDFNFTLSDVGSEQYFQGNDATIGITVAAKKNEKPSLVGTNSFTITGPDVYVFTVANFTTETVPEYTDPENDPADKLKITELPSVGKLQYDGVDILVNDIILFSDIEDGLFSYLPIDGATVTITFAFEIADSGSGLFTAQ